MKLLSISGSRNHEGQTARAVDAISKGFSEAGGETESIFLLDFKVQRCQQCDLDGWGPCKRTHRCIIKDDFALLVRKIKASDIVVFANPVYFGDLSEVMRTFLERLRRTTFSGGPPGMSLPSPPGILFRQEIRNFPFRRGTPAIGLCLAGAGGGGAASCCAVTENILPRVGFDLVDTIPVRRQNLEFKLPILEMTGRWLATRPTSTG